MRKWLPRLVEGWQTFFKPIKEWGKAKPLQFQITSETQLKIAQEEIPQTWNSKAIETTDCINKYVKLLMCAKNLDSLTYWC